MLKKSALSVGFSTKANRRAEVNGFTFQAKQRMETNGFTLVELLIVVSIIIIVTASIVPSFAGYIRNQGVKQAQENLKSDLRNIQNKALTGALSDLQLGSNPVKYWGVRFLPNSGRYEYFVSAVSNTCPSGVLPAQQLQGYSDLVSGLEVKVLGSQCLYFSLSNGDITASPAIIGNQLIVGYTESTASGDCRRVIFNTNGLIYSSISVLCT
jgi:prepilin-type N-terminal cleavage/methylation domain-containing protein